MKHKTSGMPSKGFLLAYTRRFQEQRIVFELSPGSRWHKLLLEQQAFSAAAPIYACGIFIGLWKRPALSLRFRAVEFSQGAEKTRHPFARTHYQHRRQEVEFELSEIRGLAMAERLRAMVPRLGHSPGGISCSEGSLETGFPSKQEPVPSPRGSDSL